MRVKAQFDLQSWNFGWCFRLKLVLLIIEIHEIYEIHMTKNRNPRNPTKKLSKST